MLNAITYNNSSDTPDTTDRSLTVVLVDGKGTDNGGTDTSDTSTVTISVTESNDAPTISGLDGGSLTVTEGDSATLLDSAAASSAADVDSTDFTDGALTFSLQMELLPMCLLISEFGIFCRWFWYCRRSSNNCKTY